MGFSLSGLVGEGAQQSLEEILTRQLLEAKAAEEQRARRAQEGMQAKRLTLDRERLAADIEDRDRARRDASNRFGVADMERQARLMADEEARRAEAEKQKRAEGLASEIPDVASRQAALAQLLGLNKASREDFMSPEDRQREAEAARKAKLDDEIKLINTRAAAQARTGGGGGTTPAAKTQVDYTSERNRRAIDSATNLLGRVSKWNTGPGSLLSILPATDAKDFQTDLDSLKANLAFNELAQMRAASKTGGALGAVSDREMALLQSALAGLDPKQSPAQFKQNLQKVIDSLQRFEDAKAGGGGGDVMPAVPSHGGGSASSAFQRYLELKGKK